MTTRTLDPILAAFERLVARRPEAPLVVSPTATASRREVDALARAAAGALGAAALAEGALIGLAAPNGPGFLAALLGLRRAGHAALLLDWSQPPAARARTAAEVGAAAILTVAEPWPRGEAAFELAPVEPAAGPVTLEPRIAVVKLTSGSTGAPRGILTSAAALVADDDALARTMGLESEERILAAIPMSHSYGLSSVVMPALMRGSPLAVPGTAGPFATLETADAAGVTFFPTVPAYLAALVATASPPPLPRTVRLVVSAGAPLDRRVAATFRERYGLPVRVFYGASECGGISFDRDGLAGERGTVGTAVEGVEIDLVPLAGGERSAGGRVVIRSPAVADGYLPAAPHRLGDGRFVTGDLAEWRAGELSLIGRTDDLINVKGKKVNPREVETVLLALPGVGDAAVVGTSVGGGAGEMVRAVVACDPRRLSRGEVRGWCLRHLAEHQVPRSIVLVRELPRTERGKLDRRSVVELAEGRALRPVG